MRDMRNDLPGLWRALARRGSEADGRASLFLSMYAHDDATSLAASFALLAAERCARPVWLLDLDLRENPVFHGFEAGFAQGVTRPGRAYDGALRQTPIYRTPDGKALQTRRRVDPAKLFCLHDLEGANLMVSRFRTEALSPGQRLTVAPTPEWWRAARARAGWIVIVAPPLEGSGVGLSVCAEADDVVLAVAADRTPVEAVAVLREEVEAAGGRIAGAVMTGLGWDARLASQLAA